MVLDRINKQRSKLVITTVVLTTISGFTIMLFILAFLEIIDNPLKMIGIADPFIESIVSMMLPTIITRTVYNIMYKKYRSNYKNIICEEVLEKMFDIEEFVPAAGFRKNFVEETFLIKKGNVFKSDDYIRGKYKGYSFDRSDVLVQEVTKKGKDNTKVETYFHGNWSVLEFPKNFSNYLMLRENESVFTSGPRGGLFSGKPKTHKIQFESIEFNEMFVAFAEDEHEAFYLLSPTFMNRLIELKKNADGVMTIGFINNKLHILFDTGEDQMEPRVFTKVREEDFRKVENEMSIICAIVDLFR